MFEIDTLPLALDVAGKLVLSVIERINLVLPNLVESSNYRYYIQQNYHFVASKGISDSRHVANYYACLQSFTNEFHFSLPNVACTSIETLCDSKEVVHISQNSRVSQEEVAEMLFLTQAELNPYSAFYRGDMSAYTVAMIATNLLQSKLAYELIKQQNDNGIVPITNYYKPNILGYLGLE